MKYGCCNECSCVSPKIRDPGCLCEKNYQYVEQNLKNQKISNVWKLKEAQAKSRIVTKLFYMKKWHVWILDYK